MRKALGTVTATLVIVCCSWPVCAGSGPASKPPAGKTNANNDAAKGTDKFNGWEITLKESPMGRMTWFIAPLGAKMISPILSMVVNSPDGKVFLFSAETRRYAEYVDQSTMRKVIRSYDSSSANEKYKWTHWVKVGIEKYQTLQPVVFRRSMINPPTDKARRLTSTYEEKIWIAPFPDSKAMSKFIEPIAKMFVADLPSAGIAVRRVSDWKVYRNGQFEKDDVQTELEMLSCRKIEMKPSDFKVPADYQKAHSETDVLPQGMSFGLH